MCGSWACAVKPGHFLQHLPIKSHSWVFQGSSSQWCFFLDKELSFNKQSNKIQKKFLLCGITTYCSSSAYNTPLKNTQYCVCFFYLLVLYNLSSWLWLIVILSHLCCYHGCMSDFHIMLEKMYICPFSVSKQIDNCRHVGIVCRERGTLLSSWFFFVF